MPSERQPSTKLDLALDLFITSKEAARCTARTVALYRWTLERFITWLSEHGVHDAQSITAHHVRLFIATLSGQELKASYVHIYARTIKTWLRFLHAEDLIDAEVITRLPLPRLPKDTLPAFSPEDVQRLLDVCEHERDAALVLCLLDSGWRAAECVALTIGDLDTKTGTVQVRHGKGNKDRTTYLGRRALGALLRYLALRPEIGPADPLFPSLTTGEALTVNGLLQLCRRLGERADVKHCHPHTFRRTFALWSLRAGMGLFQLAAIMGHADLVVLRRYLALVEQDLHDAHRQHGAVDWLLKK